MLLRINALLKGYSGIRLETLERLLFFLNKNIIPLVPKKGSVGASGDLVPLAHMSLPLIGMGKVKYEGNIMDSQDMLNKIQLEPLVLKAKEGLALINGTQFMTAYACLNLYDSIVIQKTADICASISIEALRGTDKPFDKRIHQLRPHPGQLKTAENILMMLKDSQILRSHKNCSKVQDAYSLRCSPQIHGATKDTIDYVITVIEREINSVTDNPIIFPQDKDSISCGNFHGQPVAFVMDFLCIAVAELANVSERRTERLVDPAYSNLPPFLTVEGGLNSGYMITQYTAAALVSENKVLTHPGSVDSIPTSANQEDHVSMGSISSVKCAEVIKNVRNVLAIELMCACQGLDFIEEKPGQGVGLIHDLIRKFIPKLTKDRVMSDDLEYMSKMIYNEELIKEVENKIGKLQ